jgi:hypothetical protein
MSPGAILDLRKIANALTDTGLVPICRLAFTDATKCGTIPFDASSSDYAEQNDAERSNDSTRSTLIRHSPAFDIVAAARSCGAIQFS